MSEGNKATLSYLHEPLPLSFIYLEKARQSFFSQTVEAKNMADF